MLYFVCGWFVAGIIGVCIIQMIEKAADIEVNPWECLIALLGYAMLIFAIAYAVLIAVQTPGKDDRP